MKLYLALCLCFLVTFIEVKGKILLTRDQLLSKIGNRHMIRGMENSLLNVPRGPVYEEYFAKDCRQAYLKGRRESGLYVVRTKESFLIAVYCEMDKEDGGWTVLMRNTVSQKTNWSLPWTAYKSGFGNLAKNHWLGNEFIHLLTRQNAFSVRFVLVAAGAEEKSANYHSFEVDSEKNGYALRLGDYSGDAGDALTIVYESGLHDNMKFSTSDLDQDRRLVSNCAIDNEGGWWYDNCRSAILNSNKGIYWKSLCTVSDPCQSAYVMIRPNGKNCNRQLKI